MTVLEPLIFPSSGKYYNFPQSLKKKKEILRKQLHPITILLLGSVAFTLLNCSRRATDMPLPFEPPESFSDTGPGEILDRWWTAFGDENLNILVDSAMASNLSLQSVWQQLLAAQAIVRRESSFLFPEIDAQLQGGISRPKPDFVGGENMQLGLSANYEVDLWGRIRASVEAERYRAFASFFDYKTATISLSAEIVRSWYQLAAAQYQLSLVEEQIESNETILQVLTNRFGTGLVRGVDILRQRQLLESTRGQQILLEMRIQVLKNQLAVLLGNPPQRALDQLPDSLPGLSPLPETGVPVGLVQRRPDVQSAFNYLKAADRDMAAAISNQFPRLNISISTAIRSNDIENLFQTWANSLTGSLLAPVFYGGRLRAEVDRVEAVKNQLFYEYSQTVLTAFREVEDALIRELKQRENIQVIERQVEYAGKAYEQLRIEYFNGTSDYLEVLTAMTSEQELRRDLVSARLLLFEYRIALYRALAGGFETKREDGG